MGNLPLMQKGAAQVAHVNWEPKRRAQEAREAGRCVQRPPLFPSTWDPASSKHRSNTPRPLSLSGSLSVVRVVAHGSQRRKVGPATLDLRLHECQRPPNTVQDARNRSKWSAVRKWFVCQGTTHRVKPTCTSEPLCPAEVLHPVFFAQIPLPRDRSGSTE